MGGIQVAEDPDESGLPLDLLLASSVNSHPERYCQSNELFIEGGVVRHLHRSNEEGTAVRVGKEAGDECVGVDACLFGCSLNDELSLLTASSPQRCADPISRRLSCLCDDDACDRASRSSDCYSDKRSWHRCASVEGRPLRHPLAASQPDPLRHPLHHGCPFCVH